MEQRNVHIEQSPHNKHDLFGAPRYTEMLNRMQQHLTNKKHCKASLNFVFYFVKSKSLGLPQNDKNFSVVKGPLNTPWTRFMWSEQ